MGVGWVGVGFSVTLGVVVWVLKGWVLGCGHGMFERHCRIAFLHSGDLEVFGWMGLEVHLIRI